MVGEAFDGVHFVHNCTWALKVVGSKISYIIRMGLGEMLKRSVVGVGVVI